MERGRRAGCVAQPIPPATVEHLESAPLQVVFGPSGRIDGYDALAVRVHLPVRAAAAVVTEGAGDAPFELAAPGAAAVGSTPRPIGFQLPAHHPIRQRLPGGKRWVIEALEEAFVPQATKLFVHVFVSEGE